MPGAARMSEPICIADLRLDAANVIDSGGVDHGKVLIDPDDLTALLDVVEAHEAETKRLAFDAAASHRADVWDALRRAAGAMLLHQDTYVALVSRQVVEERADWSEPVQIRFEPRDDGTVEIVIRRSYPQLPEPYVSEGRL